MQIVSVMPYYVNEGNRSKMHPLFYLFSGASNLNSLQDTDMKFPEYVDILVQIIYAKFENDGTMGIPDGKEH